MSREIGDLLQAGQVRVFGREGEPYRLCGLDVIHGEVHITVMPGNKPAPAEPRWTVVVGSDDDGRDSHAAPSLEEALELANPDRGAVLVAYEVAAPDAGAARLSWKRGRRLFQFAWLGA